MGDRVVRVAIGLTSLLVLVLAGFLLLVREPAPGAPYDLSVLPALNAFLNGTSAVLLAAGFVFIRRKQVRAHMTCMLSAFGVSTLFLLSYLIYHYQVGSVRFTGHGPVRVLYFGLLSTHIVLAAAIVPLALTTIYLGLSWQIPRHRRIVRWTWPLWLYVSVSGVLVYWMLYHLYPPP